MAGELYYRAHLRAEAPGLVVSLLPYLAWVYTWAMFTPLILWLTWRFQFNRDVWVTSLAVHVPASLVFAWIGALVFNRVSQLVGTLDPGFYNLLAASLRMFVLFLHFDPLLYWIIVGLGLLVMHNQLNRERELKAVHLETQLTEARLQALEMQLHPHFLFNALNTIAVLVRTNKNAQAVRVVTGLGELLRSALDGAGAQVVPLKQEIEFLERYLEIEQIRYGDRLTVEMRRSAGGSLKVSARRTNDRLHLTVHDDGPGLSGPPEAQERNGVGLSTTQERLQQIYGGDHEFLIFNAEGGGVTAEVDIPFQLAADEWRHSA